MSGPYGPPSGYAGMPQAGAPQRPPQHPPQGSVPPGYGQPPQAGPARLLIDTSYFSLAWILALTGPVITINGRPMRAKWGQTSLDLPAGGYHLRIHTRYIMDLGPAETRLNLAPGQQVQLFYRAPTVMFMNGALGPVPQKTPGITLMMVLFGVVGLLILILVISVIVAAVAAS